MRPRPPGLLRRGSSAWRPRLRPSRLLRLRRSLQRPPCSVPRRWRRRSRCPRVDAARAHAHVLAGAGGHVGLAAPGGRGVARGGGERDRGLRAGADGGAAEQAAVARAACSEASRALRGRARRLVVARLGADRRGGQSGRRAGVDFGFNAWGEKFRPWDEDAAFAGAGARAARDRARRRDRLHPRGRLDCGRRLGRALHDGAVPAASQAQPVAVARGDRGAALHRARRLAGGLARARARRGRRHRRARRQHPRRGVRGARAPADGRGSGRPELRAGAGERWSGCARRA